MTRSLLALTCLSLAGCAAGPPARTGPAPTRTLAMNGEASDRLTRYDAKLRDSSVYQAWSFQATAGQIVQIDVMSTDFDAYAILQNAQDSVLARDDDDGGGTNARITWALPATGTYEILANSAQKGRYGRYTVHLRSVGLLLPGTVGQILRGQTMTGQLAPDDPKLSDGSVYQAWTYMGQVGESIQVDVTSTDFDAYAIIQDANGSKVAADDDSGGGTNARITFTLPYTGAYRLIANTYRQGQYGSFSLSVR